MNASTLLAKCFGSTATSFDEYDHSEHGFDFLSQSKQVMPDANISTSVHNLVCSNQKDCRSNE